jgi:hypothetical protein
VSTVLSHSAARAVYAQRIEARDRKTLAAEGWTFVSDEPGNYAVVRDGRQVWGATIRELTNRATWR